jgi:hypothetical protein
LATSARRQEVLDALVAIQEQRIFESPLYVKALRPTRILSGDRCAAFWSFVDERGRVALAFAMNCTDLTARADAVLPGATGVKLARRVDRREDPRETSVRKRRAARRGVDRR